MIFCEECFNDTIIKTITKSLNTRMDSCPNCASKDCFVYDTDKDETELPSLFSDLLSIYTPQSQVQKDIPSAEAQQLIDDLNNRWNLFSPKLRSNRTAMLEIIKSLCDTTELEVDKLLSEAVIIPELYDTNYVGNNSIFYGETWETFDKEVTTKNRYHVSTLNLDLLEKYCSYIRKEYNKGDEFYRARLVTDSSNKHGYDISEMSAPPAGKSSTGRVNAAGIVCFYLATDEDTTLHEVRCDIHDSVSVARFKLTRDITVVDFKKIDTLSPFISGLSPLSLAINKTHLETINTMLSKPLTRTDDVLSYVPTQFIVDSIKSFTHNSAPEYLGVEYKSTRSKYGSNLAIFTPTIFTGESVKTYKIDNITFDKTPLLN